jgi:predicted RNase H-like HicB family nuclease
MNSYAVKDYAKVIEWSYEDQCFVGSAPPLVGPCCHGDTEEEVLRQLHDIVGINIDAIKEDGLSLPKPQHLVAA